jgi:hypothetical protein
LQGGVVARRVAVFGSVKDAILDTEKIALLV